MISVRLGFWSLTAALHFVSPVVSESSPPQYDLLLEGGRVFDGSGNPWVYADIAVDEGRIAAVGALDGATAERTLDVSGLFVMPGIIDIHSHVNARFDDDNEEVRATINNLTQGVTTVVFGESRSVWPAGGRIGEITEKWSRRGIGTNAAMLVGIDSVRLEVLGSPDVTPDKLQLERMKQLVRDGMEGGAFGIGSALDYWAGHFFTTDEVIALAEAAAPYGGIYMSHIRSEGTRSIWWVESDPSARVTHLDAIRELIDVARAAQIPVHIAHIKSTGIPFWGKSRDACRLIEAARAEGVAITADQYPYTYSGPDQNTQLFKWETYRGESIPPGTENPGDVVRHFKEQLATRMENDAIFAQKVKKDVYHEVLARGGADRMFVTDFEPRPAYVGESLSRIASSRGEDLYETARYLQLEHDGVILSYSMSEEDIAYYLTRDYIAPATDGFSERLRHPRSYGTFPRFIRKYVIEEEVVTLPFFVRKATSLPASIMGFDDRGWIQKGYWADIAVFDPEEIRDRATLEQMDAESVGVEYVLVNGKLVIEEGRYTGELAGQVILRN